MYFITGASRGIGAFLMSELIAKGEEVQGCYHSTNPNPEYSDFMTKVDISDPHAVEMWIGDKVKIDTNIILINCAGINYSSFAHKADLDRWKRVVDVNLVGTFVVIQCLLPHMRKNKSGRIINFSSVVAQKPVAGTSAYAASKAALWGMSKSIAAENASKGITINNINLGYFDIGMIEEVNEDIQDMIKTSIPSKEFGNPKEILETVNYLVNTEYLNGVSLDLSGGLI